jgi:cephalosporin hydroxylase
VLATVVANGQRGCQPNRWCGAPYRFADAAGPLHGVRRDRVLVSVGSYCIVFDTVIEDLPAGSFTDRPWDVGNNPKTAVYEWLKSHPEFEIDKDIDNKLLISVAPDGYLRRVR